MTINSSLAAEFLEHMRTRRHELLCEGICDLAHVEVPVRVHADRMGSDKIPGGTAVRTDPAEQDIPLLVKNRDMSG